MGKTLTVDGIRITAAAEADVDLDAVVAAGPRTARSIQLIGPADSISPETGTLTIGTNTGDFGGLGVAGNVHVGRGLYVDTDTLVADSTTNRVGIGKTNPDATLDVDGDAIIRGDLSVLGTTTTIDTENLRVQDPIIELGKDNAGTGDLGLVMTRPTGSSNVAIIFDENADTLEIGYTDNDASATDITMVSTPLSVNINGDLSVTSNLEVSGNINGDLSVTSNLEVGTANLFVDTVNSRVGIGTDDPVSGLTVFRDIESSNSFITERVLFRETWPNGYTSLEGDLGTWVLTNIEAQNSIGDPTTPDGYTAIFLRGLSPGQVNGALTSPTFDLSLYALPDGTAPSTRAQTTRVFLKCWFATRGLTLVNEVAQVQISPDNGSTWHTVATSQDTQTSEERFTLLSADLSPYILDTSTQAKIRFYMPWTVGNGDYMRVGRIWIHESDVPTNLGGMWLGAGGNIGIGTTNPVGVNGGRRLEGSSSTGFEYIATNTTQLGDGEFIGGYLFKNVDINGTEPHYAGMTAYANETFGRMDLRFFAGRDVYETDPTVPHMTLDQDGQLGIGTTDPSVTLSISRPNTNGAALEIRNKLTAAIEETASYASTKIRQKPNFSGNDRALQFESYPYGGAGQNIMQWLAWNSTNDGWLTPITLTSSGNLTISGSYSPSDDRLKTNEAYIENATETLLKLKPQKYDKHNYSFLEVTPETYSNSIDGNVFIEAANIWVDANTFTYSTTDNVWYKRTLSDVTHEEAGLIAQDIWYDTPELRYIVSIPNDAQIPETKPEVSDDPTIDPDYENWGRKNASVNYTYLIPYLIKSNQELHTELQTVKARLDTLENA